VAESRTNYQLICGSLKAMGVYTDTGLLRSVCTELISTGLALRGGGEISACLTATAAALERTRTGAGNITDPQAAARIVDEVREILHSKAAASTIESGDEAEAVLKQSELSEGAAENLAGYLVEWIRRQALLRFVHATALARPGGKNVLHAFFAFLARAAREILSGAEKIRRQEGEPRVSAQMMLKAIRKNESPLRSRCASVVSTQ
jgi:hypothetical protein